VEINNTFYRLPKAEVLAAWGGRVPASFRFALKASRRITHIKRLKDAGDETAHLLRTAATLAERLGPLLFQLPPTLRKDVTRLERFLDLLPDGTRAAFEFRHASWLDDDVVGVMRARRCALCVADVEDVPEPQLVDTAGWGYLRLRRPDYSADDLDVWAQRLRAQPWREAFVFFKHEGEGVGPRLAGQFLERARAG
jgi:uncharacterized protein YecE (DUF72 family)